MYVCLGSENTLDMHVYSKNTSIYIYIYVCLGSTIPWICIYIAKIPHKIYICLGCKIPHEKNKQKQTRKRNQNAVFQNVLRIARFIILIDLYVL